MHAGVSSNLLNEAGLITYLVYDHKDWESFVRTIPRRFIDHMAPNYSTGLWRFYLYSVFTSGAKHYASF